MNLFLTKNAPITKDAPIKRGGKLQFNLGFKPATVEEITKAIGPETPDGYIAGWASTAGRDLYNHEVIKGAFQESMDKRGLTGPTSIKFLLDHDWQKPAGVIKVLEYRRDSLWMEAQMNLDVSYVKERWQMLKMMGGANFSVGFMLQDYEIVVKEDETDSYLRIDKGDLFEVSTVLFPGNEECQMTFVKASLHDDNPDEDELFFTNAKTASWKMGGSKNLPTANTDGWDGAAAKGRLFKAANFDGEKPDLEMIKKAFLAYDSANPELRGSYKLPFADIVDGKMQATSAGIHAAASRLPNTGIPDSVKSSARAVLDHYETQLAEEAASTKITPTTLAEFEKALVARGLVQGRNAAREIALVAKSCPQLFQKTTELVVPHEPALDAGKLTEVMSLIQKMKAVIAPVAD